MKYLVVAALLTVACLGAVAGSVASQPNQAPNDKQHHADNREQAVLTSDHKSATNHTGEADDNPPHWYTPLKRPEWWLVGFGFGAVIVAWRTLNAINRQVAMFISKERGRLAVELEPIRSGKKYVFALGYIQYGDVFGNAWRLRFSRQWRASFQPDGTLWHGDWSDYGAPEANSECQIKQPSRLVKLWSGFGKGRFPQP